MAINTHNPLLPTQLPKPSKHTHPHAPLPLFRPAPRVIIVVFERGLDQATGAVTYAGSKEGEAGFGGWGRAGDEGCHGVSYGGFCWADGDAAGPGVGSFGVCLALC